MKKGGKIILLLLTILSITAIQAQKNTETEYIVKGGGEPVEISFYGGPIITFSTVYNQFAYSMGGEFGITLNNTLIVGGYTEHYLSNYEETIGNMLDENDNYLGIIDLRLRFNQVGGMIGYVYKASKPVHIGLSSRFGWGGLRWKPVGDVEPDEKLTDNTFVITPRLNVEMNLTPWSKLFVSVGHRFVVGIDETYNYRRAGQTNIYEEKLFDSGAFDSFVVNFGFYFGIFD